MSHDEMAMQREALDEYFSYLPAAERQELEARIERYPALLEELLEALGDTALLIAAAGLLDDEDFADIATLQQKSTGKPGMKSGACGSSIWKNPSHGMSLPP